MSNNLVTVAYIAASALFILSIGGSLNQESAKRGNWLGMVGMAIAFLATAVISQGYPVQAGSIGIGILIGVLAASRVAMTAMPEMVAFLNSFVGLAAVLVGFAEYLQPTSTLIGIEETIHQIEIYVGVFIGIVTFTGSMVAVCKLQGIVPSRSVLLPARHVLTISMLVSIVAFGFPFMTAAGTEGWFPWNYDGDCGHFWHCDRHGYRRGRYGGGDFVAQQLFGSGLGGGGLYAQQRPADYHGSPGGQQWSNPQLHHVQRHEPLLPECGAGRLWRWRQQRRPKSRYCR
jgi:hypothetical protein